MSKEYRCYAYPRMVQVDGVWHYRCNYTWAISRKKARVNIAYQTDIWYKNISLNDLLDVTDCI